ncbi:uncharacterized protein LOC124368361 [Homalodisca vitripennis]|uniref:uncharacterized protein LOC124368361 n=1 Tax=Homalodisca vitripennis TaxID=197043 RepID=UPI001EEB7261|nr:uncharacterized protein LOC124368361 [Homalodisca vitripennis]
MQVCIQVKPSSTARVQFVVVPGTRLEDMDTSVLRLEIEAMPRLFHDGRLRLRCVATQYTLYRRSAELDIHEDTPHIAPVLGPTAPPSLEPTGGAVRPRSRCLPTFLITLVTWCLSRDMMFILWR